MKNRAVLVMLGLALALPVAAASQTISGGFKGGASFGSMPEFVDWVKGSGVDIGSRRGFIGGVYLTVGSSLALQPEVIFSQKGLKATSDVGDFDIRLDYVDVPVLLRYTIGAASVRAYVFGGPSFNINLKAEAQGGADTEDMKDDVESSEISLVFGGGVEISRLLIEARWMEGMKNVAKDTGTGSKTRTFAVMAGFRF